MKLIEEDFGWAIDKFMIIPLASFLSGFLVSTVSSRLRGNLAILWSLLWLHFLILQSQFVYWSDLSLRTVSDPPVFPCIWFQVGPWCTLRKAFASDTWWLDRYRQAHTFEYIWETTRIWTALAAPSLSQASSLAIVSAFGTSQSSNSEEPPSQSWVWRLHQYTS